MILRDMGISQKALSRICNINQSIISRYISSNKIKSVNSSSKIQRYNIDDTRKILKNLFVKDLKIKKKIQCFYNFKGGTGKTSLCFQAATHLSLCGFKVLVVDADPQGHISTILGFRAEDKLITLFDIIAGNINIEDAIVNLYNGLDCIPSNLSLTRIALSLDQMPNREKIIQNFFKKIENHYDFILFDTNPAISTLNRNIIVYSQIINIVCETQALSINGLKILFEDLKKFFHLMSMEVPSIFIIPNKYEDKMNSSAESMSALINFYFEYLKPNFAIRKSEDINNAVKQGLPISCFARNNSNSLEDIIELIREIVAKSSE